MSIDLKPFCAAVVFIYSAAEYHSLPLLSTLLS